MRDPVPSSHAKAMRREMSEPETPLWLQLRAKRFDEIKFRRQEVIGHYIVDFAANAPKLAIELDGDSHAIAEAYDARRTGFLKGRGYRVVRFTNGEVMENLDGVLLRLDEVIRQMKARPPLPILSPEGERAS